MIGSLSLRRFVTVGSLTVVLALSSARAQPFRDPVWRPGWGQTSLFAPVAGTPELNLLQRLPAVGALATDQLSNESRVRSRELFQIREDLHSLQAHLATENRRSPESSLALALRTEVVATMNRVATIEARNRAVAEELRRRRSR